MLDGWSSMISSAKPEIDVEEEITNTAGEIIAKTSFGLNDDNRRMIFQKLLALQLSLFKSKRFVGVPFSKYIHPKQSLESKKLEEPARSTASREPWGRPLREDFNNVRAHRSGHDVLLSSSSTWTLLLLAIHTKWQNELREEIKEVIGDGDGDGDVDATMVTGPKKMGWVIDETLRLTIHPSIPNLRGKQEKTFEWTVL
ncbi:hypothetical protein RJ639_015103 [Escallonia herrerae]|uniref:Uncharacterized protein n=1 Tax=Escallonia herrerae TaxID=1293975 RepID=A0AA89AMW3_9ASTE|nr:hypothetical protein RJ639_015103 [Escallonia herrerae]